LSGLPDRLRHRGSRREVIANPAKMIAHRPMASSFQLRHRHHSRPVNVTRASKSPEKFAGRAMKPIIKHGLNIGILRPTVMLDKHQSAT